MAAQPDSAEYKSVRGLIRGLQILQALNKNDKGRATSSELSASTGLHRTTVRRLLETLVGEGYVRRSSSDDSFRLTIKVRELSEGFTDSEWISTIATPVMGELLQTVIWPSDLTTPGGDAMLIRETTHRFSPLSFHRSMVGRRLPYLLTAAGRAYFGSCGEEEREDILGVLRSGDDQQSRLAHDEAYIRNLVKRVQASGVGTNEGDWDTEKKIGAIAMPIFHRNRVLGCLNIVYLTRALAVDEALKKYGAPLRAAVEKIGSRLDAQDMAGA
jgi:IclR family mhp operon transcriptional activator